jgi:hypothetical protein
MAAAQKSVSDTFRMKMRPNLSIERLAITLAALAACSRSEPAAVRPEQTPPTASASAAAPPPPQPTPDEGKKNEGEKEPAPTTIGTAAASARPITEPRRHVAPGGSSKGTGQASCGAGTCTADPKKK